MHKKEVYIVPTSHLARINSWKTVAALIEPHSLKFGEFASINRISFERNFKFEA